MSDHAVPGGPRLPLSSRWVSMQLIESCRHRADLIEATAQHLPPPRRNEFAAIAEHWRACAAHIQLLHEVSDAE